MHRLGITIGTNDFSVAELSAATLDGDLVRVDEYFAAIDLPDGSVPRAMALEGLIPHRHIAERMSAAWVYGVLAQPPVQHQLCVDTASRAYTPPSPRITVREVVITNNEIRRIAGLPLTTPLRTISDIARSTTCFTDAERRVVASLMESASLTVAQCEDNLNSIPHLPNKLRAIERIHSVAAAA